MNDLRDVAGTIAASSVWIGSAMAANGNMTLAYGRDSIFRLDPKDGVNMRVSKGSVPRGMAIRPWTWDASNSRPIG